MKSLTNYISEKLLINKNYNNPYTYEPKSFNELREIIEQRYKEQGPGTEQNPIDFNDIDVSKITTFYDQPSTTGIFDYTKFEYIDVSDWDVSNVEDMTYMFYKCFNLKSVGDLSKWNISNIKSISFMFYECNNLKSAGDLSNWNVSNVKDMNYMFDECKNLELVGDLSRWNINNVKSMKYMFFGCEKLKSVGDLSDWDISNVKDMSHMFASSGIKNKPDWYKK